MDPSVVLSAFALLFVAELGDKTQLMTIMLAQRYRPLPVALGVCAAFLVLNLLAVLAGSLVSGYLPRTLVLGVAGVLFLGFAWQSWHQPYPAAEQEGGRLRGALFSSFGLIFVAELGDKTQLAMIALVAGSDQPWSVFAGGTLALWCVALLGIALGATLLARLPQHLVQRAAALLFALFGLLALAEAYRAALAG